MRELSSDVPEIGAVTAASPAAGDISWYDQWNPHELWAIAFYYGN